MHSFWGENLGYFNVRFRDTEASHLGFFVRAHTRPRVPQSNPKSCLICRKKMNQENLIRKAEKMWTESTLLEEKENACHLLSTCREKDLVLVQ